MEKDNEENSIKSVSLEMNKLQFSEISSNIEENFSRSNNNLYLDPIENKINRNLEFDYIINSGQNGICKSIKHFLKMTTPIEWIFVITFSIFLTIILSIFDEILSNSIDFRYNFCTDTTKSPIANFFLWIFSAVIFLLLATSSGYFISQEADGSGIPEVKTVLSGFNIFRYFSFEAFIAKIIGLYFSMVGGKIFLFKTGKVLLVEKLVHLCTYLVYCVTDF